MKFNEYEEMVLEAGHRVMEGEELHAVVDEYLAKHPSTNRRGFKKQVTMVVKKNGNWHLRPYNK